MRHLFRSRVITLRVPQPRRSEPPPPLIRALLMAIGATGITLYAGPVLLPWILGPTTAAAWLSLLR